MADTPTVLPFIPETITVHLGPAASAAPNVTVPFTEYIKNVASSEIYPTWSESALRANILAITSFALNRVYTEYYRSRGYDFDITNNTAVDQAFVSGRSYFENISRIADDIFDSYLRRPGFVEPLAAKFCNGTTSTCDGLSQWGSEELAQQGYNSVEILRYYYGDDIEIVTDAPIEGITESYPGTPLRIGSAGPAVTQLQAALNRIGQSYPAIPKITVNSIYGPETEAAVRAFQEIFNLSPDGIVGRATWYQVVRIFVAVTRLNELQSRGQREFILREFPQLLARNDTGPYVEGLQYMLQVIARFIPDIPETEQTGIYDNATVHAVRAFQQEFGLPDTGVVDSATWNAIYEQFAAVEQIVFDQEVLFPQTIATRQQQYPGQPLLQGTSDGGTNS